VSVLFECSQELIKPTVRLSENPTAAELAARTTALSVLYTCLDFGLRLLHPLMPFITEELYHRLPGANLAGKGGRAECGSIMVTEYPNVAMSQPWADEKLDQTMELLQLIAHSARSTRASLNVTKTKLTMHIKCGSPETYEIVKTNAKDIAVMSVAQAVHALKR
jgi:valyl-tRNA synthetase